MRIFIGLKEVAGHYTHLLKGFESLGIECDFLQQVDHKFKYENGKAQRTLFKIWQKIRTLRVQTPRSNIMQKLLTIPADNILKFIVFIYTLIRYDVLIFSCGMTFYESELELKLYKKLGKKLFFAFHGSDSRPSYLDGFVLDPVQPISLSECIKRTEKTKKRIETLDKYATYVINAVSQSYFHTRKVVNFFIIGLPFYQKAKNLSLIQNRQGVIALHCPSQKSGKGTKQILEAIDKVKRKGINIELKLLEGIPNPLVLEEIQKCDFVIDQLYSDSALAGFATEAAYFGKPAVVGGYFVHEIRKYIPENCIPPSLFVDPSEIETAIEKMATDELFRKDLGRRAQEFVINVWNPTTVAARYLRLINGDPPEFWFFEPRDISYLYGSGMSKERVGEIILQLVSNYGEEALCLEKKESLKNAFLSLAFSPRNVQEV